MVLGVILGVLALTIAGGFTAVVVVQVRALKHIEAQRVVGGLPPDAWQKQQDLESRRVAIQEREIAIKESMSALQRAREDKLFEIEVTKREAEVQRMKLDLAAKMDRLNNGSGHFLAGS